MTGHVFIYGGIGDERGEVSFNNVQAQLADPEVKNASDITLHIISNGGDVMTGEAIYNALKNTGKEITTHIEGTCASIATLIAAAGSKIVMNKTARFMIHNPKISGIAQAADATQLRGIANQLDQIKTLLINVYDKKTSLGKEKLWELYDNETWLTADEAQRLGFIDESVDAIKAVAKVDLKNFKMEKKKPTMWAQFLNLLSQFKNESTTLADGTVIQVMTEDGEWAGKQVITEDGNPLAAGEHPLVDGRVLVVDGSGIITEVKEAAAPADQQNSEEMDNKIKELEAQLAEAKGAKEKAEADANAAKTEAVTAKAKALKYENRVTEMEKEFLALREAAGETVGDKTPPAKGPTFKNANGAEENYDPMAEFVKRKLKARSGQ